MGVLPDAGHRRLAPAYGFAPRSRRRRTAYGLGAAWLALAPGPAQAEDLPSWNDTAPKKAIVKALDEAQAKGWTVVDMKNDWKLIYPFEKK